MRRWHSAFVHYAEGLLGAGRAGDVVQDAWLSIVRNLRRLDDPACFRGWAFSLLRRRAIDRMRADGRRPTEPLEGEPSAPDAPPEHEDLHRALRQLPPDQRELLHLRYREDLSVVELATVLGVPPGTVKSRLHTVRNRLREILERSAPGEENE